MFKNTKGFLQVGLAILIASVLVGSFAIYKYKDSFDSKAGSSNCSIADNVCNCKGWSKIGGSCCPSGAPDACSKLGTFTCVTDPFVSECQLVAPYCPKGKQYAYQAVTHYSTTAELMKDPRCKPNNPPPQSTPTPSPVPTRSPSPTPSPSPVPTRSPSPTPTPTHSPTPTPTKSPSPSPTCSPTPSKTPSPTPKPTKSPVPTCSPTPTRSPSPTPSRSPSPKPTHTPTCSPSPTPVPQCNSFCLRSSQCLTGMVCSWGKCRNPSCTGVNSCVCPVATPTPTPKPTRSPSPVPSASPTATPVVTPSPSPVVTPSPTPVQSAKLKVCKYNDSNNNGQIDSDEKMIAWNFIVRYQDLDHKLSSNWWNFFNRGCVTTVVPSGQWINVTEMGKDRWNLTGIYQDGNWVGTTDYNYLAVSGQEKTVTFLNYYSPSNTPVPTSTGEPNSCNGTCGSNYNCQGGFFCYNGFCRNPACPADSACGCVATPSPTSKPTAPPVVLGATAPPTLPKTGSNILFAIAGLLGSVAIGGLLFKRFRLV